MASRPTTASPGTIVLTEPRAWMHLTCDRRTTHGILRLAVCGAAADRLLRSLFGGMDAFPIGNVPRSHSCWKICMTKPVDLAHQQAILTAQAQTLFHLVARGRNKKYQRNKQQPTICILPPYIETWTQLSRVADICAACSISRHIWTDSLNNTHNHPQACLERRRIMLACKELARPGQTITSIADQHGWSSPFALSRSFKRIMGISPRHWLAELES